MRKCWHIIYFFGLMIFIPLNYTNAQSFANKEYYLVDSLILEKLGDKEKQLVDSSLLLFYSAKHDTDKVKALTILIEESWDNNVWPKYNNWLCNYLELKFEKTLLSYNPEKDSPSKLFMLKSFADALNNKGLSTFDQGNYSEALEFYNKSLVISYSIEYKFGVGASYNNIAVLHQDRGEMMKALESYFSSLKIMEELEDKRGSATGLNNVANIFRIQGDLTKAYEYYTKSLKISEEENDSARIAYSLNDLALILTEEREYDKALKYYGISLRIWESFGFKNGIAHSLNRIGNVKDIKGDDKEALDYYYRSLAIWEELGDKIGITHLLVSIGNIYFDQNELLKAKGYALRSFDIAKDKGIPSVVSVAAELLSQIYEKEGRWKDAFEMQQLYIVMKDSVRNSETEKDIIRQQASYEIEKKEQEILLLSTQNLVLEKDNEVRRLKLIKNRVLIIGFFIALGLILILVVLMLRGSKKKQLINELLEKQKEHYRLEDQEKSVMMKEIHHRVKNNLQIVSSLLKFQSSEIEDEKIVAMFEETQNRILSMAHLHEKLYQSDDLKHVDVQEHFTSLVNDLIRDYGVGIGVIVDFDVEIEEVDLGMKTLVPLGLIINELITNSLKHGFKDLEKGTITIYLKQIDQLKYELIIGDNGVGMDKNFKVEDASSLGTQLVQIFVEQLEGTMERLDQPGTVYRIVFEKIDKD